MKWPFQKLGRGDPVRAAKVPMIRRPFQPAPPQIAQPFSISNYFQKPDHFQKDYRMANGLCLACGSSDHTIEGCPHKRMGVINRALPAPPVPIGQRNPGLGGTLSLHGSRLFAHFKGEAELQHVTEGDKPTT